jgi:hypothetical protein
MIERCDQGRLDARPPLYKKNRSCTKYLFLGPQAPKVAKKQEAYSSGDLYWHMIFREIVEGAWLGVGGSVVARMGEE